MKLLAQQAQPLGKIGGVGLGPFGDINTGDRLAAISAVTRTISSIVGIMTILASIWFMFMLLFAGYEWISAGGDQKKLTTAKDRITHAFTGLVIVVGAYSLAAVAGQFFGFNTLIDPNVIINTLPIK
jgi:hypothetical protein